MIEHMGDCQYCGGHIGEVDIEDLDDIPFPCPHCKQPLFPRYDGDYFEEEL